MTCHCKGYAKTYYPSRHIVLSFCQMKNVGRYCERSLMFTLLLLVVVHHTIFQTRSVYFWCIANEVIDWWFDIFNSFYTKLIYWLNISFDHHICCFFIVCNHVNCFIEQNSQLAMFLLWDILIVDYCTTQLLRKWSCKVDGGSIWSIRRIDETLLFLIWG